MPEHPSTLPWDMLFPKSVAVVIAGEQEKQRPLHEAEQACTAGAVEKRKREFVAGRNCLHDCLTALGLEIHPPILMGKLREPLLPTGYIGTISHCSTYCVAAAARLTDFSGLGLDVEHNSPLEPGLSKLICLPNELAPAQQYLQQLTPEEQRRYPDPGKLIFSIKESFYKAYFPRLQAYFDFMDVEVTLDLPEKKGTLKLIRPVGEQTAQDSNHYHTSFQWDDNYIYSAISISAD